MRCEPEEEDPFSFEGPEIYKCSGSSIDWLAGKNLTVKQVGRPSWGVIGMSGIIGMSKIIGMSGVIGMSGISFAFTPV